MSWIAGVGLTPFGRLDGMSSLDLMVEAATLAINDAGLDRPRIDGLLCGYTMTEPHVMLSAQFGERFGITPSYAHAVQVGGATGGAAVMLAHLVADAGVAKNVLVVIGENRLSAGGRDATVKRLSDTQHPYEVALGMTVPAAYGLIASRYMHEYGLTEEDFAELAVLMRRHAALTPGAQYREPITVADVMRSRPIASPLKLLDCSTICDGAVALVVSAERRNEFGVRILGGGQAHAHKYASSAKSLTSFGGRQALDIALARTGLDLADVRYAGVYDSFTITLALLLEELGLAERGASGAMACGGWFDHDGTLPLNTHGGLLSYGHCGAGGSLVPFVETHLQMTGRAAARQADDVSIALVHGDGGILSSHVSVLLEQAA